MDMAVRPPRLCLGQAHFRTEPFVLWVTGVVHLMIPVLPTGYLSFHTPECPLQFLVGKSESLAAGPKFRRRHTCL